MTFPAARFFCEQSHSHQKRSQKRKLTIFGNTKQVIQDHDTVFDNSILFHKNDPLRIQNTGRAGPALCALAPSRAENGPFILARHPACRSLYSPTTTTAEYLYASMQPSLTSASHSPSPKMRVNPCSVKRDLIHTQNVRTWMAHEMIEEGKLLKMIHKFLHDSLLASATGNSAPNSDHSTAQ